jgi:hypothetical protein
MIKYYLIIVSLVGYTAQAQNVGVGTNTPQAKLHVVTSTSEPLRVDGANPYIGFYNSGAYSGYLWYNTNRIQLGTPGGSGDPVLIAPGNIPTAYFTTAGNVGIGVAAPLAKLDVSTTSQVPAKFNGSPGMYIPIHEGGTYRGYLGSYSGNDEDLDFGTGLFTAGKLHLTIGTVPQLTIDNGGRVGVGITTPHTDAKLHINSTGLRGAYLTSSAVSNSSSILTTEATGALDYFATGISVNQLTTEGRGRGLNVRAGYVGGEFTSIDNVGASQNYGIIARTYSNGNAWGVYGVADDGGYTGGIHIGVYGTAQGGSTNWAFYGNGNAFLLGGTWQASDERLKQNIQPVGNAVAQLRKLSARTYLFDRTQHPALRLPEEQQFGFLASDVEKIFPNLVKEIVHTNGETEPGQPAGKITFKGVNYNGLIPVISQAVNEHTDTIEALKKENAELKKAIQQLNERLSLLEKK